MAARVTEELIWDTLKAEQAWIVDSWTTGPTLREFCESKLGVSTGDLKEHDDVVLKFINIIRHHTEAPKFENGKAVFTNKRRKRDDGSWAQRAIGSRDRRFEARQAKRDAWYAR